MKKTNESIWSKQSTRWSNVGSPTRPSLEDSAIMTKQARLCLNYIKEPKICVLGVTPEIIQLDWPNKAKLYAFDSSKDMIKKLWIYNRKIDSQVSMADWNHLPLKKNSMNFILGDGSFTALQGIEEHKSVTREIERVLKNGGSLIMRCFIRPNKKETINQIKKDVESNKILNFGTLKWRIAMALTDSKTSTVQPSHIYNIFHETFKDLSKLTSYNKWTLDDISTLDSYANMSGFFTFLTESSLKQYMPKNLKFISKKIGNYELAERCPTMLFKKNCDT